MRLHFSYGNKKLSRGEAIFSLPAGHSCPFAKDCKSFADRHTGKITDGPHTIYRCYAASLEVRPAVRNAYWRNFDLLRGKNKEQLVNQLLVDLPDALRYRIHSSGDFFSQDYFDAWVEVARKFPERTFYAYTKAIPFWVKRLDSLPKNFILNASLGGTHDKLIAQYGLKSVRVVPDEQTAKQLGLAVDHDDSLAWKQNKSFALVIHGTQPKGTDMSKAWQKIKDANKELITRKALETCHSS